MKRNGKKKSNQRRDGNKVKKHIAAPFDNRTKYPLLTCKTNRRRLRTQCTLQYAACGPKAAVRGVSKGEDAASPFIYFSRKQMLPQTAATQRQQIDSKSLRRGGESWGATEQQRESFARESTPLMCSCHLHVMRGRTEDIYIFIQLAPFKENTELDKGRGGAREILL